MIEKDTGVRPRGWSSPSVYPNADTFTAVAAEGIGYSLDAMDSDVLSRLATQSGWLILVPYPVVAVDMGPLLGTLEGSERTGAAVDRLCYRTGEGGRGSRPAGHGRCDRHTSLRDWDPCGAAALRRVLENFKRQERLWVTDLPALLEATGEKP